MGGDDDAELLGYGRGLRIQVVGPENTSPAARRRWLVQPRFSPVRVPQFRTQTEEELAAQTAPIP